MIVRRISNDELYHHGIKGQKWGVRRYQNSDGSLNKSSSPNTNKGSNQYNPLQRAVRGSISRTAKQKRREIQDWKNVKTIRAQRRSANRMATKEIYAPIAGAAGGLMAMGKFGKSYKSMAISAVLGTIGGMTLGHVAGKLSNANHAIVEKYADYKIKQLEHEVDNYDTMLGRKK